MNAVLSDPAVLSIKKTPNINDLVKAKLRSQIGRKRILQDKGNNKITVE
jgi:hypothetical protein